MAFERIGKNFKAKSGKATTIILSKGEVEKLMANLKPNEKYGEQVKLVITGTADSKYGHSLSLVTDEVEGGDKRPSDDYDFN